MSTISRLCFAALFCLLPFFSSAQPAPSLIPYRVGDLWGYADSNGVVVVPPQFDEAYPFLHQLEMLSPHYYPENFESRWPTLNRPVGLVKKDGLWGLLDAAGKVLLPAVNRERPEFAPAGKGTFWVRCDVGERTENHDRILKSALLSQDGQLLTSLAYDYFTYDSEEGDGWGDSDTYGHSSFDSWGLRTDAEYLAVRKGQHWGMISVRGEEVIPPVWESVLPGDGVALVTAMRDELPIAGYGGAGEYLVGQGNRIIRKLDPGIEIQWRVRQGFFLLRQNGLLGCMNAAGEMTIPFSFSDCYGFTEDGLAKVYTPGGEWLIVNTKGETLFKLGSNGGCWRQGDVYFIQEADELWYTYDKQFRKIGSQGFQYPSLYTISLCGKKYFQGKRNGRTGLISVDGQVPLPFECDTEERFQYLDAWVDSRGIEFPLGGFFAQKNGNMGILDCQFREVVPFDFRSFHFFRGPDLLLVQEGEKRGIYNFKKKQLVLPPVFDEINFHEKPGNFFAVRQGDYWGKYDLEGRELLPVIFGRDLFQNSGERFKLVKSQRGWHVFDKDDWEISSFGPIFEAIFNNRLATLGEFNQGGKMFTAIMATVNGKLGLFDLQGKTLVPPDFDHFQVQNDFVFAKKGGKTGVLTYPGLREVVPFEYKSAIYDRGKFRLYDTDGTGFVLFDPKTGVQTKVQADYSYIGSFSEGLGLVHRKCIYGFVDENFNEVMPLQFTYAYNFSEGLAAIKTSNGKWGYLNKKGEFAIAPKYLRADNFHDGMAQVEFQNLPDTTIWRALIDRDGRELYAVAVGPDANIHRIGKFVVLVETYENQTVFDSSGQIVLQHCTCVHADYPSTTVQFFCDGKAGLLLPDGSKRPADHLFDLQPFSGGLTGVYFCQAWGLRDSTGRWVIPMAWQNGSPTDGGVFMVWRDGQAGLFDRQGRMLIPAEYDQIFRLGDYWQVTKNGLLGLFGAQGRLVVPPKYAEVEPLTMLGLIKATLPDGKVDFYDFRGHGYFSE